MSNHDNNPFTLKSTAHYMQWREHIAMSLRAQGLWNFVFDNVKELVVLQSLIKGKEDDPQAIMWHLDKELRPKTNAMCMDLLCNFVSIRRKPDKEIEVFFVCIEAAQAELEESGMVASPAYQLLAILDGLPPKYNAIHAIIKLEDRIDMDAKPQDKPMCYYCHKPGHVWLDCPKLHAARQTRSRANAATDNANSSSKDKTILSITNQVNIISNETDSWYLNSSATQHITCWKDLLHNFVNYSHKDHGLLLGNNYQCPVLSRGTIKATITINRAA
ncbi:zinc knuckle domain containing protein [Acanthamoeba castellanii str. Neff]|uniref:Zinc knuckle domain containing protein n=1 Tax=Acanthamoeba castellanii (strain ATCC 30010 / Neff) TaxID=1257118 RepID=L8H2Z2_ACACF|nr:zinc knuckle domain containing protein [Acanthamoeba castellanii str. Neff]ELR18786.1 zinc knuckle domain containing protein [Acanthamoeba castellanii str. Neff]